MQIREKDFRHRNQYLMPINVAYIGDNIGAHLWSNFCRVIRPDLTEIEYFFEQVDCKLLVIDTNAGAPIGSRWASLSGDAVAWSKSNYFEVIRAAQSRGIPVMGWIVNDFPINSGIEKLAEVVDHCLVSEKEGLEVLLNRGISAAYLPLCPSLRHGVLSRRVTQRGVETAVSYQGYKKLPGRLSLGKDRSSYFRSIGWDYRLASDNPNAALNTTPLDFMFEDNYGYVGFVVGTGKPPVFELVDAIFRGALPVALPGKGIDRNAVNPLPEIFPNCSFQVIEPETPPSRALELKSPFFLSAIANFCFEAFLIDALRSFELKDFVPTSIAWIFPADSQLEPSSIVKRFFECSTPSGVAFLETEEGWLYCSREPEPKAIVVDAAAVSVLSRKAKICLCDSKEFGDANFKALETIAMCFDADELSKFRNAFLDGAIPNFLPDVSKTMLREVLK